MLRALPPSSVSTKCDILHTFAVQTAKVTLGAIKTIVDQNTAPAPPNPMPAGGLRLRAARKRPIRTVLPALASANPMLRWLQRRQLL